MAWIRATCRGTEEVEGCGDVEIRSTEVIIRICENLGGVATYIFKCPECGMQEVYDAPNGVVEVFSSAGVEVQKWCLPEELGDEGRQSKIGPVTHDDLLDFHEGLVAAESNEIWAELNPEG